MTQPSRLYPGDLVDVKTPDEILRTLDADGAVNHLPFMPEMAEFCGRRFRVSRRVVKTCSFNTRSTMHAFAADDVVLLEELRCSGAAHDGCEKACMIFWRECWLRKVAGDAPQMAPSQEGAVALRARLKTTTSPNVYFCQASELTRAARQLSRPQRFTKCFDELSARNCNIFEMAQRIAIWMFWRIRRSLLGPFARGENKATPAETLNLRAGEWVEVKPLEGIRQTLNDRSSNRGLWFSPEMRLLCGKRRRVAQRIDKIIVDGTGEMRKLHNTVYLEGSMCGCAYVAFGGCSRGEFNYWREIWVRPADPQGASQNTGG